MDWFGYLSSKQNLHVPSCLYNNNTGAEKGLELGCMIPWSNISVTCFSILAFWMWGYLNGLDFNNIFSSNIWMWWSQLLFGGRLVGIVNKSANASKISSNSHCSSSVSWESIKVGPPSWISNSDRDPHLASTFPIFCTDINAVLFESNPWNIIVFCCHVKGILKLFKSHQIGPNNFSHWSREMPSLVYAWVIVCKQLMISLVVH